MVKICFLVVLAACAQAAHYDNLGATSHVSFNNEQNTVHHIHSAPTVVKAAHSYAAPSHSITNYASPSHNNAALSQSIPVHSIPSHDHTKSYSSLSVAASSVQHSAPVSHYVSVPVHHHHSAPSVHPVQYSASVHHNAQYATPDVAKVAAQVQLKNVHHHQHEEEYAPAKYEFAYGVEDHQTGDIHAHKESRDGDVTHGEYSLHEADGTIRTVRYTVDKHSGFNAVVERSGHPSHQQVSQKVVVPTSHHGYHH